jgi:hypothetical protein
MDVKPEVRSSKNLFDVVVDTNTYKLNDIHNKKLCIIFNRQNKIEQHI